MLSNLIPINNIIKKSFLTIQLEFLVKLEIFSISYIIWEIS